MYEYRRALSFEICQRASFSRFADVYQFVGDWFHDGGYSLRAIQKITHEVHA